MDSKREKGRNALDIEFPLTRYRSKRRRKMCLVRGVKIASEGGEGCVSDTGKESSSQ